MEEGLRVTEELFEKVNRITKGGGFARFILSQKFSRQGFPSSSRSLNSYIQMKTGNISEGSYIEEEFLEKQEGKI